MTAQLVSDSSSAREFSESSVSSRGSLATVSDNASLMKLMKSYQADQQVEYLHLQAEIEVLFQQLQALKQQKLKQTDRHEKN
ncbi:MAG: hypothetical protein IGR93_13900 [Hydrococcus sp. C42_A2020_068]|nr:hypothetical protein [Hydrococcus sp. C42_A2020_068]